MSNDITGEELLSMGFQRMEHPVTPAEAELLKRLDEYLSGEFVMELAEAFERARDLGYRVKLIDWPTA